jgi:hypothetical protein
LEKFEGPTDYSDALRAPIYSNLLKPPMFPESVGAPQQFEHEASIVSLLEYARSHPRIPEHLGASYTELFESLVRALVGDLLDR